MDIRKFFAAKLAAPKPPPPASVLTTSSSTPSVSTPSNVQITTKPINTISVDDFFGSSPVEKVGSRKLNPKPESMNDKTPITSPAKVSVTPTSLASQTLSSSTSALTSKSVSSSAGRARPPAANSSRERNAKDFGSKKSEAEYVELSSEISSEVSTGSSSSFSTSSSSESSDESELENHELKIEAPKKRGRLVSKTGSPTSPPKKRAAVTSGQRSRRVLADDDEYDSGISTTPTSLPIKVSASTSSTSDSSSKESKYAATVPDTSSTAVLSVPSKPASKAVATPVTTAISAVKTTTAPKTVATTPAAPGTPAKPPRSVPAWLAPKSAPPLLGQKTLPVGNPTCLAYGGGGAKYVEKHGSTTSNTNALTFVISGVLESMERDTAEHLIKRHGGRVTGSVTGKTDYLLCGSDAGAKKTADAAAKGVKVIDEDKLFDLIIKRSPGVTATTSNIITTTTTIPTPTTSATSPTSTLVTPTTTTSTPAPKRSLYSRASTPAVSTSMPAAPKSGLLASPSSDMWVEKWKPLVVTDIVGNGTNVSTINDFLQNWHKNLSADQASGAASTGRGATKSSFQRAILLSGPPGIGKTTAATLCARACGFEVLEFNASDVRSKNSIREEVGTLLDNRALSEFFVPRVPNSNSNTVIVGPKKKQRVCVIMDEVDGVSSSDRGGIAELISLIKTTKTPIICICNDGSDPKMRTLKNYCLHLTWRRPTAAQILPRMTKIAAAEGLSIDKAAIERLVTSVRSDLRQTLNSLQMWALPTAGAGAGSGVTVTYDMAHQRSSQNAKDFDVSPFEVAPEFFRGAVGPSWFGDRINAYFVDSNIMPLFVQENYLSARATVPKDSKNPEADNFLKYCAAADLISEGDILGKSIMGDQNFALMPAHGAISTVIPGAILGGGLSGMLGFPSVLGKMSTTNKNRSLLNQLKAILVLDSPQSAASLALDYLPVLRGKLMRPLANKGADGMDEVMALMEEYGLTRGDWDTIMDLGEAFSETKSSAVDSKTKAAFTRASKKDAPKLKVTRFGENKTFKATKTRGGAGSFRSEEDEWEEINGELNDEEDDDEEEKEKKDEMEKIKQALIVAKPTKGKAIVSKPKK